jgi:hypothetical protein
MKGKLMKTFTVIEIMNFIRRINCMSYDEFKIMYEKIFEYVSEGYVQEKWEVCRRNVSTWMCSLDTSKLEAMMMYTLKY